MAEQISPVQEQDDPTRTLLPEEMPQIDDIVTEDDTPVDNFASEKQQRLLTEPLYSSWSGPDEGHDFLVAANVGLFFSVEEPPLVPDVFLSLDVTVPEQWWEKGRRAYFLWQFGKLPEVVIEIVSNRQGGEADAKMNSYVRIGIPYYVIYDPLEQVQEGILRAYELRPWRAYAETSPNLLEGIGLGLTLWQGEFENRQNRWLRWQDEAGVLIPTGAERAEQERQRAERLAAQLRELGVEPEEDT